MKAWGWVGLLWCAVAHRVSCDVCVGGDRRRQQPALLLLGVRIGEAANPGPPGSPSSASDDLPLSARTRLRVVGRGGRGGQGLFGGTRTAGEALSVPFPPARCRCGRIGTPYRI
jgi:hypothetical protein